MIRKMLINAEDVEESRVAIVAEGLLEEFDIEVDDKTAYYHFTTRQAFIWPYDEQARLIGEHLYMDETSASVQKVDPSEVITSERVAEIHQELLNQLESAD
jgi:hypothetical protein